MLEQPEQFDFGAKFEEGLHDLSIEKMGGGQLSYPLDNVSKNLVGTDAGGDQFEVQFNDGGGAFAGDADFKWNSTTNTLTFGDGTDNPVITTADDAVDAGTPLNIVAESGINSGTGGEIVITAGNSATADAGYVRLIAGESTAGSAAASNEAYIDVIGNTSAGASGGIELFGGNSAVNPGGAIVLTAGNGPSTDAGGDIFITSGSAGVTSGDGGRISLVAGSGTGAAFNGGVITISSGSNTSTGSGGSVNINAGSGSGAGENSGHIVLRLEAAGGGGTNGRLEVRPKGLSIGGILDFDSIVTSYKTFTFQNFTSTVTGQSVSALTSTRVPFADANGLLTHDADLTFVTDTLSATKVAMSSLTSGRVPFATTAGLLVDDADMTFSGDTLTVTKVAAAFNGTIGATTPAAGVFTSLQADSITNDTGLAAGTYTPTDSAHANLDGTDVTMTEAQYMRVGNTVTVSGRFTADPTTTLVQTSFEITLPVASNIGAVEDVAGVAVCGTIATRSECAEVIGVIANDTAKIQWIPVDVASQTWSYTFTYQVI